MKVYQPKISLMLIKTRQRLSTGDAFNTPADSRMSDIQAIDLTPFLSDFGGVTTTKSVREQAGAFSITLADKPHSSGESLYGLIEPMDVIEIRISHDTSGDELNTNQLARWNRQLVAALRYQASIADAYSAARQEVGDDEANLIYDKQLKAASERVIEVRNSKPSGSNLYSKKAPLVMRAFVTKIKNRMSMDGGKPVRTVTISGHDYGKILGMIQITYLATNELNSNVTGFLRYFTVFAGKKNPKAMPASAFIAEANENMISPFINSIGRFTNAGNGKSGVVQIIPDISISGVVDPYQLSQYDGVTLYEMLKGMLDVGLFNEMYIEDREDAPYLVVRPIPNFHLGKQPFASSEDTFIESQAWAETMTIGWDSIIEIDIERSDERTANYFVVGAPSFVIKNQKALKDYASYGESSTFSVINHVNCEQSTFGLRMMRGDAKLMPPSIINAESPTREQSENDAATIVGYLKEKRDFLIKSNQDNSVLENGEILIKGNPHIRAGMYITIESKIGKNSIYYVTRVNHRFGFSGFRTSLQVERGTGFYNRMMNDVFQFTPVEFSEGVK